MKKRIVVIAVGIVIVAAVLGIASRKQVSADFAMGSVLTQTWWGRDCADLVLENIRRLEQDLLSATEAPEPALEIMEASGGAFTPYLGALVKLWNINDEPYLPTQEEIEQALQKKEIDLGAYGKGAACDAADMRYATFFPFRRPCGAVINLGGNIMTYGDKPWWQPFKVALRDPKGGPNDTMGVFTLGGTWFISTSGSYEKYFERDGVRYHHIFDPETGYPACREPGLVSVTVINDGGAIGDMISTACFVLGYEDSLALLEEYGCEAIFIYQDGTLRRNEPGWPNRFEITNPFYHWYEA